jgi:flagellar P-ring protein precursor FlgI
MSRLICALVAALTAVSAARAQTADPASSFLPARRDSATVSLKELAHIEGTGQSTLRGMGLVTGLKGTGDAGTEEVLARPLAELYKSNGNTLPDLKVLAKSKAAAIVFLWAEIPEAGARKGDRVNVYVKVSHSATSLAGGMLDVSPVLGPLPHDLVWGSASGMIELLNPTHPTVGIVYNGLQITQDITMVAPGNEFNLIVRAPYRDWSTTRIIAAEINDLSSGLDDDGGAPATQIAHAVDNCTVHVTIPGHERADAEGFIATILDRRISPSLLNLPPQVIASRRTGSIVATGNVEISAVVVASQDLVVTTTTPPPVPSALSPITQRDNVVALQTLARPSEKARVQDLLNAFKQLDVPVEKQIEILSSMHRTGHLHANLVIE